MSVVEYPVVGETIQIMVVNIFLQKIGNVKGNL
jgi:hypothetical protein